MDLHTTAAAGLVATCELTPWGIAPSPARLQRLHPKLDSHRHTNKAVRDGKTARADIT
jgi:hypothetical protein